MTCANWLPLFLDEEKKQCRYSGGFGNTVCCMLSDRTQTTDISSCKLTVVLAYFCVFVLLFCHIITIIIMSVAV